MRKRSICLIKCIIGLSVAFIAVSNCFNVMSNSSTSPTSAPDQTHIAAHNSNRNGAGLDPVAGATRYMGPLDSIGTPDLAGLAVNASARSPFAPTVTATKSHTPSGSANPGDTLTYTVVISNSGTSDATGVNFTDAIDPNTTLVPGSVKASPIAADDSYHTIGNVNISVPVAQGVTANDSNSGFGTLTVTKVNATTVPGTASTANGSVTMNSNGSFSYTPNVAFRGPSDSFTYELDNGSGSTDTATVTIAVTGLIWFVDSSAASGGDGRLSSPFNCLVGAGCFDPVAADIANDNIFVYSGAYIGGLTLLNGQKLIGQGAGDTLLNITALTAPSGVNLLPSTGGSSPTIASAGAVITLGTGNTIRGVVLNGTAAGAVALSGSGFGTATIAETSLGGTGKALDLNSGTLTGPVASTAAFVSISSTGSSTTGVSLTSVAGNMSSGSTSVSTSAGIGISVNTSSAALNFGTTSSTASGGTGVSLTSNTGAISFGALTITPNANQRGLLATENSQTITTAGGAITTSGANAVEITRTVGTTPLAVSLTAVSASSAANGIKLTNTSGSFTVTGDGGSSNNGSGGTISASTAEGVLISTASNVSLGYLNITNSGTNGIRATGVNGFTLNRSNISDNAGNNLTDDGVGLNNTSGALSITNSAITASRHQGVTIDNNNTNMASLTMSANSVTGTLGGDGVLIQIRGTSVMTTGTIGGATAALGNTLSNNSSTGLQVMSADTANISNLTVQNNTVSGNNAGMDFDLSQTSSMTIRVLDNTLTNQFSQALNIFSSSTSNGVMTATVQNNNIGTAGVNDSGSAVGSGVRVIIQNGTQGAITIDGNQIREVPNSTVMDVEASGNTLGDTVKVKITNNNMPRPSGTNQNVCGSGNFPCPLSTVFLLSDTNVAAESVCALITGNSAYDPTFFPDGAGSSAFYLARRGPTPQVLNIEGNTLQTPRQVILNNNTVTDLTSPGFGDFTDESGNVTVVPPGTCGVFPMSLAPELEISMKNKSPHVEEELLIGGIGKAIQEQNSELTQAELDWTVQAALARWQVAGISGEDRARLDAVTFNVDHLRTDRLAGISGTQVRVDSKAGGFGWYIDATPDEDGDFDVQVTGKERQASEVSPAYGKIDLLTVVMRELATIYLQGQPRTPKTMRVLMESTLAPSVRRMPVFNVIERSSSAAKSRAGQSLNAGAVTSPSPLKRAGVTPIPAVFNPSADLSPGSYGGNARRMSYSRAARSVPALSPFSGETVNLNIGTIPAGKSVTIMFQVTINNPFPNGVCSVTNQGHVTGTNFSQVDTNSDVTPINKAVTISACPANVTTNTDPGVCTAVVMFTTPTGDGCPAPTVTCSPASGFAFPKGTTTVTCTATNGTPPDATCTFTVTVNDAQAPTITCPANVSQGTDAGVCTAIVTYANATATDNCPGVGTPVCTPASGTAFNKGTTTVTCTVSDASSNSANCSFTVAVNDTTPPTISCPASVMHGTDPNVCNAVVTYPNATATDNCPGVGTPVCSPSSGSTFVKGVTTVTCTVSDASSNSANCSFSVTVKDTQAPNLGPCPNNISVTSSGGCQVVTYTQPTATDNCGSATVVCSPGSGTCFPAGTTTVTCTASDTSPDSPDSSCSFTVTVVPCAITCPSNITLGNSPGQCGATVTYSPNTNGGCGTIVCSPSSGSFFPVGTTTVVCTTTVGPSCSFTVTVNDTEGPHITVTTQPIELWPPNHKYHTITMSDLVASATDNCSGNLIGNVVIASVSSDELENSGGDGNTLNDIVIAADCKSVQLRAEREGGGNGRVYTIVLRVKDAAGNVGTASRTVTVPLSQGSGPAVLGPGPGYSVTGTCP